MLLPVAHAPFIGDAQVMAHPMDERCQGKPVGGSSFLHLEFASKVLDEHARPEDPRVSRVRRLASAQILDSRPAPKAPHQPSALEVGPAALALTFGNKPSIGGAGTAERRCELTKHLLRVLPEVLAGPDQRRVPAPRELVKRAQVGDERSAERVQVDVADEFEKIGFLLDDDGLVAILKEMSGAACRRLKAPAYPVRRLRMLRGSGRPAVRRRKWAWFGSRAHA